MRCSGRACFCSSRGAHVSSKRSSGSRKRGLSSSWAGSRRARELAADVAAVLEETSTGDAVRSYGVLAEVFVELGDRGRALNLYELAVERADKWSSPFLREVYSRMAQILEDEGRKDEAYAVLKKALQLEADVTRPVA